MIQIVVSLESKTNAPQWIERVPKDLYKTHISPLANPFEAWLTHIVENYERLEDFVLFLRVDPLQFSSMDPNAFIQALMKEPCLLFDKTTWLHNTKCLPDGSPHHLGLPIVGTYSKYFPGRPIPQVFEFIVGAQCMSTKERIRARPKAFYEAVLQDIKEKKIEDPVLERLWPIIVCVTLPQEPQQGQPQPRA